MKRILILLLAAALLLTGCAPLVNDEDIPESFTIYASFYPIYALSALLIDGSVPGMTLHQLAQPQDGCLRDYSLSDWDSYLLFSAADAVILGGAGLESFSEALYSLGENGPAVVSSMSALVLKSGNGELDSHFSGVDPWLFLSVDGAEQITEAICANMAALDEPYAQTYIAHLEKAYERFSALRTEMEDAFSQSDRTIPVALMHEGLSYFADEWGLNVVLTLEHESGVNENEETLKQYLALLHESGARAVLIEQQAPEALIQALDSAGLRVALFDTLSTGREQEGAEGYFIRMKENARRAASVLSNAAEN